MGLSLTTSKNICLNSNDTRELPKSAQSRSGSDALSDNRWWTHWRTREPGSVILCMAMWCYILALVALLAFPAPRQPNRWPWVKTCRCNYVGRKRHRGINDTSKHVMLVRLVVPLICNLSCGARLHICVAVASIPYSISRLSLVCVSARSRV